MSLMIDIQYSSLLAARRPRLHSIKGPFQLILGGFFEYPHRSRTRHTEFKLIEKMPSVLRGQFRFPRGEQVTDVPSFDAACF